MKSNNRALGFALIMGMLLTSYNINAQTLKIMPLGNSITQGKGDPGTAPGLVYNGYRNDLCQILYSNGWDFDFVGSQKDGYQSELFDVDQMLASRKGGSSIWQDRLIAV